jgi:hypothetical protein
MKEELNIIYISHIHTIYSVFVHSLPEDRIKMFV